MKLQLLMRALLFLFEASNLLSSLQIMTSKIFTYKVGVEVLTHLEWLLMNYLFQNVFHAVDIVDHYLWKVVS